MVAGKPQIACGTLTPQRRAIKVRNLFVPGWGREFFVNNEPDVVVNAGLTRLDPVAKPYSLSGKTVIKLAGVGSVKSGFAARLIR